MMKHQKTQQKDIQNIKFETVCKWSTHIQKYFVTIFNVI